MNETQHDMKQGEAAIDILAMVRMLLSKLHWLIVGGLVVAAAAYFYTVFFISPLYVSNITMYVYSNSNTYTSQQGSINAGDLSAAESLAQTYALILKSNTVADAVVAEVQSTTGENITRGQVKGMTSVSTVSQSQLLSITVTSTNPILACNVASAFGKAAPDEIIRITKAGGVELVDTANVATSPSSPNIKKNTFMGFMIGAVITAGIFIIATMADTTIYLPEDVAKLTDATILGEVPQFDVKEDQVKSWTMVQGGSISHGKKKESES